MKKGFIPFLIGLCILIFSGCYDTDCLKIKETSSGDISSTTSQTESEDGAPITKETLISQHIAASSSSIASQKSANIQKSSSVSTTASIANDPNDTLRKAIEKKYSVQILYGEETFWNFENNQLLKLRDTNYIKIGLNNINNELSRYPSGFFAEFSRKLRIFMVTSFSKDYSGLASYDTPGYFDLYLSTSPYSIETLHHEIMHMIDFTMMEKKGYNGFNTWDNLNPPNFAYTNEDNNSNTYVYSNKTSLINSYFVSAYAKKENFEDRAELFKSLMMNENTPIYISSENPIKAKIIYLCSEIRRVFKSVQATNTAEWEKNIK